MRSNKEYNTKQKENLLSFLVRNKDRHTNVQEISAFLAGEGTPVGTATIYRQLDRLVEQGMVRKFLLDGKTGACYQYISSTDGCNEHFHLKCISCGKLIHFSCHYLSEVNRHIYEEHGFTVNSSQTVFYGKCTECSRKEEQE